MLKEKISLSQLAAIVINFHIGSSIVIGLGLSAKEDAWIALLISLGLGIFITLFFIYLANLLPGKNLFEMFEYCFSRPIAIGISLLYSVYFLYYACRIIRDFGELIASIVLPITPIEVSTFALVIVIGFILYLGLEVLARTAEIFTPYAVTFNILLFIFLYVGGNLDISNIKPILGEGLQPLWKVIFPFELIRPYGQLLVLTLLLNNVTNSKYSKKIIVVSVTFASILLILSSLLIVLSLGYDVALRSTFPLLSAARLVSIGEFLQRIDAIVIFCMMLGTLVKSAIYFYSGLQGLEYVFKLPFRMFVVPMASIVSLFSIFIARNYLDHIKEGLEVGPFILHLALQFVVPTILVSIILVKKRIQSSRRFVSTVSK